MTRHLLVIGAQRCGTTSLYAALDAHPDIAMARPVRPEPKVFLSDDLSRRGADWYRATYFGHATTQQVLGEKSTSYLEDAAAPGRVIDMLGTATIVVQLRDPVARAVSNWRFSSANGFEARPLREALEADLDGSRPDWDRSRSSVSPFAYLERGRYVDYLRPWWRSFSGDLHVRFLEEVAAGDNPWADAYAAAGVDPAPGVDLPTAAANASGGTAPSLDDSFVSRLRHYFAAADAELAELLGRPLPWPAPARPGHVGSGGTVPR